MENQIFHDYFQQIYGNRWSSLFECLKNHEKESKVSISTLKSRDQFDSVNLELGSLICSKELKSDFYQLDLASVQTVGILDLNCDDHILDLCAAPGGKALTSYYILNGQGTWSLNELSQSRLNRLKSVFRDYTSDSAQESVQFFKSDGSRWGLREKVIYNKVICDVPCSGERYLLKNKSQYIKWSLQSSKRLAIRQYSLLVAALNSTLPGGQILYSTCSINPIENDGVIAKLLKKKKNQFQIISSRPSPDAEATDYGFQFLPDHSSDKGPMYSCLIKKFQ